MVRIVWTEISINDLKEIHDYISKDSIRYASITINKIYQNAQVIKGNSYVGRIVPEFNEILIRELITGNYRIIYRIANDVQVDILRIYHIARLLKRNKM
jgi:toxin ParE1/3/4